MIQYNKDLGRVSVVAEGAWNNNKEYDKLSIVYNKCDKFAYISRKTVPVGVDIENREYWQPINVNGYADNNFINLTTTDENNNLTAYENVVEAATSVNVYNRRVGAVMSFYNINSERLDRQAEFELWQFNSTDVNNWTKESAWQNIYYNWNVFVGWYIGLDSLKNHIANPTVGQYAYIGSTLNDAVLVQCRTNNVWTLTNTKIRDYISVKVEGNVTIGSNGHWYCDGNDTGIPATPSVDEELDNIVTQIKTINTTLNALHTEDARIEEKVDTNKETLDKKINTVNTNLQSQITSNDNDIASLNTKHTSLKSSVDSIAATGGASVASAVTYKDNTNLGVENVQDAIIQTTFLSNIERLIFLNSNEINATYNYFVNFGYVNESGFVYNKRDCLFNTTKFIPTYYTRYNIRHNLSFYLNGGINVTNICAISCYDKNFKFLKDESIIVAEKKEYTFSNNVSYVVFSGKNVKISISVVLDNIKRYLISSNYQCFVNDNVYKLNHEINFNIFSNNGYINYSDGKLVENKNHYTSQFIKVNITNKNKIYIKGSINSYDNVCNIAVYDKYYNFLKSLSNVNALSDNIFTLDDTQIQYIRITLVSKLGNVSIYDDDDYYYYSIEDLNVLNLNDNNNNNNNNSNNDIIDSIPLIANKAVINSFDTFGYINNEGIVYNHNDIEWGNTNFIPVTTDYKTKLYKITKVDINKISFIANLYCIAAYDKNFNFLKDKSICNTKISTYTIDDDNIRYIRFSSAINNIDVVLHYDINYDACGIPVPVKSYILDKINTLTDDVSLLQNNTFDYKTKIICDGDSLTYGDLGANANNAIATNKYPSVLQNLLGDSFEVLDYGIPAAPSTTITSNVTGYLITDIIERNNNSVILKTRMLSNDDVNAWTHTPVFSHHNSGNIINPCYLNGIKGYVSYNKRTTDSEYFTIFTSYNINDTINVKAEDILFTSQIKYNNATHIIFMGANGGFSTPGNTINDDNSIQELIKQYKMIISKSNELYICISNYTFTLDSGIWKGEAMFDEAFGKHHINLRKYLVEDGISDALDKKYLVNNDNVSYPTESDTTRIKNNCVPYSLLSSDKFHLNDVAYHLLGDLVYKKYKELYKEKILGTL